MRKILVVDDSMVMRNMIRKVIENNQLAEVMEAKDADDALMKYQTFQPDVVTMDITMPGKSGIEAVKQIKSVDKNANIIMITAMGQKAMVVEALNEGARDFIVKPFEEEKLVSAINKIFKIINVLENRY
ncbi:response regulator [Bacillus tianshenii]|nr:response regulator [Bacillus tianshenii]